MLEHNNAIVHILWMMQESDKMEERDCQSNVREDALALALQARERSRPVLDVGKEWILSV